MQTTLILDDDVAVTLERLRETRGESLKTLINQALREGLQRLESSREKPEPFRTKTVNLGRCYLENLDNVAEVLARVEGEAYR